MKTIGLIGGMSWESTQDYYRIINQEVNKRLGGVSSAKILMYSFDFAEVEELQHVGKWDELGKQMLDAGRKLEKAGADMIAICTNTMHKFHPLLSEKLNIPVIHIGDATGENMKSKKIKKAGLLGTKFTMEGEFYANRIKGNFDIDVIIPNEEDREIVHRIIYEELVLGKFEDSSREKYNKIIRKLQEKGAEGVILGCTEIPLLVNQEDVEIPLLNTTEIHAKKVVEEALK